MEPVGNPELAPHYYRDNFLALCDTVEAQYGDLLAPGELHFLQRFRALPFDAQCLYVRFISRVGPWFRESKLAYGELGEIPPIIDCLLDTGLVETAVELSAPELGRLYTRAELVQAFGPLLTAPLQGGKPVLLAAIEELALDELQQGERLAAVDEGRIVGPLGTEEVQLFQLLFFGNRHQSLTD